MKSKLMRINMLWMLIAALFLSVSCDDDDDDTTTPAPVVLDGYYAVGTSVFTETMATAGKFGAGVIEGAGYAATPRDSMYQKYMYISSTGNFLIKQQKGAQVITWGVQGSLTTTGDTISGTLAQNGGAMSVGSDGFYFVIADLPTMKIHMLKVNSWGVLGDATGSFNTEDEHDFTLVSADKENGEWKIENVTLKEGGFKFRFNHQWTYVIAEGAPAFTNLGGAYTDLTSGGANITMTPELQGIYTLTLKHTYGGKFTMDTLRTGTIQVEELPDSVFMVGTLNGWSADNCLYMSPKGNDVHYGFSYLVDTTKFLILGTRGVWTPKWGTGDQTGTLAKGGADIATLGNNGYDGAGFYCIKANLSERTIEFIKVNQWGVIGGSTPGGWDTDTDLTYDQVSNTWIGQVIISTSGDGYKFRMNHAWAVNLGGDLNALTLDGGNMTVSDSTTYNVTLNLVDKYKFSATVTAAK